MSATHAPAESERVMTNEEVAALIGVHYSTVSRLAHGERMPSGVKFFEIVRVFRLDIREASEAFERGPYAFAPYFREHVTDKPKSAFPWLSETPSPETNTSPDA